ncbi:MAG: LON peptidase substrate-binding domain-containing protein [Acidobacteriota bacterium]
MSALPPILPVFPLTGSLLLPGGLLPLHIFEPRYRHMVEDALEGSRHIGMVQPKTPNPADNRGDEDEEETPAPAGAVGIYEVGCVGVIEQYQDLPFGRYLVVLQGVSRFRIQTELPQERGYRRVEADYAGFENDLVEEAVDIPREKLLAALRRFSDLRGVEIEIDRLSEVPPVALLNGLAMSLPLAPVEKQALLEAEDVVARHSMLLALLEMGIPLDEAPTMTN